MVIERALGPRSRELASVFPLTPIDDERSYRSAIAILDRLFARGNDRTLVEIEYFRELARLASEYEDRYHSVYWAPSQKAV